MKKRFLFGLVVIVMLFLCSCSLSGNETNEKTELDNSLSRDAVNELVSRNGFGRGQTDVETVVLDYVYHDAMFAENYGNDFCVDDIGGTDEGNTLLFPWLYEASGDYFVVINGDTWWISVSKSYLGKWEVIGYSQETENPDN